MATTKGLHGKKGRGKGKRAVRVDADKRATIGMVRVKTWSKIEVRKETSVGRRWADNSKEKSQEKKKSHYRKYVVDSLQEAQTLLHFHTKSCVVPISKCGLDLEAVLINRL